MPEEHYEAAATPEADEFSKEETAKDLPPQQPQVHLAPWKAHLAVFLATVVCFSPLYSVQALYPSISARFGEGVTFAAALLTICTVGLCVFSPIAGRVAAGAGMRVAVQIAFGGLILSNLAIALTDSAAVLLGLRLLQGCLIPIGLAALLASLGSAWRESGALGLSGSYSTGVIVGGLLGRAVPAGLVSYGWTIAFVGFALLQTALATVALKLFPPGRAERAVTYEPVGDWLRSVVRVVREEIPAVAIGGFALMATQVGVTSLIAVRMSLPPFEWTPLALGALYLVFLPAIAVVRVTPAVAARHGTKRTLLFTAVAMNGSLAMTLFDVEWLILVGMVGFSACVFAAQTVLAQELSITREDDRERASSGYLACYYAGASGGALAPVAAWHAWGWPGCVAVVVAIQCVGAILALSSRVSRSAHI